MSALRIEFFELAGDFLKKALPFLLENEVSNFQVLGAIAGNFGDGGLFSAVYDESERVVLAAAWTPNRLVLSSGPEDGIRLLVDGLLDQGKAIQKVKAEQSVTETLSAVVCERCPGYREQILEEAFLYRLDQLKEELDMPAASLGCLRPAVAGDVDKLCSVYDFDVKFDDLETRAKKREELLQALSSMDDPLFFFLDSPSSTAGEEAIAVSVAKWCRWTDRVAGIQGVYTPLNARKKGYGTAVVHALCSLLVKERGFKTCVLCVETTNGSANHVYKKIGFQVVEMTKMVTFVPA